LDIFLLSKNGILNLQGCKLVSYQSINFPQSLLTVVTSAAKDAVCGVFENSNNDTGAFQAITN
jgi:hypothetical protein